MKRFQVPCEINGRQFWFPKFPALRPDYPVDDKKANSEDLPITRISKCAEEGYLTLNIVWVHLSSYKSKRYIKYTVV